MSQHRVREQRRLKDKLMRGSGAGGETLGDRDGADEGYMRQV